MHPVKCVAFVGLLTKPMQIRLYFVHCLYGFLFSKTKFFQKAVKEVCDDVDHSYEVLIISDDLICCKVR